MENYIDDDFRRLGLCHFRVQLLMQYIEYHDGFLNNATILSYNALISRYGFGALWCLFTAGIALRFGESARDGGSSQAINDREIFQLHYCSTTLIALLHPYKRRFLGASSPAYAPKPTITPFCDDLNLFCTRPRLCSRRVLSLLFLTRPTSTPD